MKKGTNSMGERKVCPGTKLKNKESSHEILYRKHPEHIMDNVFDKFCKDQYFTSIPYGITSSKGMSSVSQWLLSRIASWTVTLLKQRC